MKITPTLPAHTPVMLRDDAPAEVVLAWGAEAVFRVLWQSSARLEGDWLRRTYWLRHAAHGRLVELSETYLRTLGEDEARGQTLLYREQVREGGKLLRELWEGLADG